MISLAKHIHAKLTGLFVFAAATILTPGAFGMQYMRLRILDMPWWANVYLFIYWQSQDVDSTVHFYSCHYLKLKTCHHSTSKINMFVTGITHV